MTTGRINQVAAEIYFVETERGANTERLGVSKFISSRLGWVLKMRPRMSFALVICITLPGGVCVQRNFIFSCWTPPPAGFAAPASFLDFLYTKEVRQPTARRAVACVKTRSYRCVPFGSI